MHRCPLCDFESADAAAFNAHLGDVHDLHDDEGYDEASDELPAETAPPVESPWPAAPPADAASLVPTPAPWASPATPTLPPQPQPIEPPPPIPAPAPDPPHASWAPPAAPLQPPPEPPHADWAPPAAPLEPPPEPPQADWAPPAAPPRSPAQALPADGAPPAQALPSDWAPPAQAPPADWAPPAQATPADWAPPAASPPAPAQAPTQAPPAWGQPIVPPPAAPRSGTNPLAIVGGIAAVGVALLVVLLLAVTLLGTTKTSTVSADPGGTVETQFTIATTTTIAAVPDEEAIHRLTAPIATLPTGYGPGPSGPVADRKTELGRCLDPKGTFPSLAFVATYPFQADSKGFEKGHLRLGAAVFPTVATADHELLWASTEAYRACLSDVSGEELVASAPKGVTRLTGRAEAFVLNLDLPTKGSAVVTNTVYGNATFRGVESNRIILLQRGRYVARVVIEHCTCVGGEADFPDEATVKAALAEMGTRLKALPAT